MVLIFFAAVFVSFVGSLQIGPVNLAVVQAVIRKDVRSAYLLALGGALPELVYSAIAVLGISAIEQWQYFKALAKVFPSVVLIGIGIYLIRKKPKGIDPDKDGSSRTASFFNGLVIAFLNPQLITFWATVVLYLKGIDNLYKPCISHDVALIMGSATGALLLFSILIELTRRNKVWLRLMMSKYRVEAWIGGILAGLGVGKLLLLLLL